MSAFLFSLLKRRAVSCVTMCARLIHCDCMLCFLFLNFYFGRLLISNVCEQPKKRRHEKTKHSSFALHFSDHITLTVVHKTEIHMRRCTDFFFHFFFACNFAFKMVATSIRLTFGRPNKKYFEEIEKKKTAQ